MQYNKNNLAVSKIADKGNIGVIKNVLFTGNKTVATDSFMLIEMSVPKGEEKEQEPFLISAYDVEKVKGDIDITTMPFPRSDETFPKYEQIIPDEKREITNVTVNADYLIKLLQVMKPVSGEHKKVKISFSGENRAIVLTADNGDQNARALLMPITNN